MGLSPTSIAYRPTLDVLSTQQAIKFIKDSFEDDLAKTLCLHRVSAPLFVTSKSGLNDGLNGVETPISFDIEGASEQVEIVHSLAKWKRMALKQYEVSLGQGIYTDMNAIRKDEKLDFIHSVYVDQWDWEIAIGKEQRTLAYLKQTVRKIYACLRRIGKKVEKKYPFLHSCLPEKITFISTSKLEKEYPHLSRKEREDEITRKYGAVFLYGIGYPLKDGMPHDGRAADYDDWKLNGDILVYYPLYDMALELSSMGIRVDEISLEKQLKAKGETVKLSNPYCQDVFNKRLPYSIGGGIGQSRLCFFFLQKAHIGEVQASIWDEKEVAALKKNHIDLL